MPTRDIRTNIVLEGEKQYKQQLSEAMQSVKLLGLQVKENSTVYKSNNDSVEGNREKLALLSKEMEQQQKIIDLYTDKIEKNRQAGEGNSKETQNLEEKLIKARTALAAMNNEFQQTSDKMPSIKDKIKDIATHMGEGLVKAAEVATKATVAAFTALGTACVSAGKAIYDLTGQAGTYADTILTMSETTGIAAQDLMKWEYASQFIDTSVDTITGSMKKLTTNMASESAATSEAFAALGVSVKDSTGHMRDSEAVFWDIIDALGNIDNATERDQTAMTLLGKSAQDLNPLINAGSAAFKELGDKAAEAGLIMSDQSLKAFGEYDDAMNEMKSTLTAAGRAVAEVFLPATKEIINSVTEVVQAFIGMVQGVDGAKEQFTQVIDNLINNVNSMIETWLPQVLEMGVDILLSLTDGVLKAIPKLAEALPKVLNTILTFFIQNLPKIIESGVKLLSALIEGIIKTIPTLVSNLPQIISAIVSGLMAGIGEIFNVGKAILQGLWEGIQSGVSWLWDQITALGGGLVNLFKKLLGINSPSKVMRDQVGKPIIEGIVSGISNGQDEINKAIGNVLPGSELALNIRATSNAARSALAAPALSGQGANGAAVYELSASSINRLSAALVGDMTRAGIGEAVIVLNGREFGRTMRRGLESGFV